MVDQAGSVEGEGGYEQWNGESNAGNAADRKDMPPAHFLRQHANPNANRYQGANRDTDKLPPYPANKDGK
jgi:hypothetical protein